MIPPTQIEEERRFEAWYAADFAPKLGVNRSMEFTIKEILRTGWLAKASQQVEITELLKEAAEEIEAAFVGGGPRSPRDPAYRHWMGKFACDNCEAYEGWTSHDPTSIHTPDCLVTRLRAAALNPIPVSQEGVGE